MLLIATDEAGYGPKLGPLVIAGTVWQIDGDAGELDLHQAYAPLARPVPVDGQTLVIGDSKAIFKPDSARRKSSNGAALPGYHKLQTVTLAGCRWCGLAKETLRVVADLAPSDVQPIAEQPWLAELVRTAVPLAEHQPLVDAWSTGSIRLVGIESRVITAAAFNRQLAAGGNKSDLLSAVTLQLVRTLIEKHASKAGGPIEVYCDRHGGRRYYAGPLQVVFDDTLVGVIGESNLESSYRVPFLTDGFRIRFTVKGDSFAPVAFSSMVAKYLREKAMECFNAYFCRRAGSAVSLRPTAGYPVDADRFLSEVSSLIDQEGIDRDRLVRQR